MNPTVMFDLFIAFATTFFTAQGDHEAAAAMRKLRDLRASGANINKHMQAVADRLMSDDDVTEDDWLQLSSDIDAEIRSFLARPPS